MVDVIVIGAGFAGLSAAVELCRRGATVMVLEARPHLGGRATAFKDRVTGELVDNGQHVLFGCYHETFRFLSTIGAADRVRLQTNLEVVSIDSSGHETRFRCPPLPAPLHLIAGLLEWDALSLSDRIAALRILRPLGLARRQRGSLRAASPGETVEGWLVRNGQTRRLRELFWRPLALAALNQAPDHAGALPFVRVLADMAGSSHRDAAIGLPTVPLDRLYAEPARSYIEAHRGGVRTDHAATLTLAGDGVTGVRARASEISSRVVISAVPWFALRTLFTDPGGPAAMKGILGAAEAMASSPIATVNLWLDRPVLSAPFVGLPGRAMQWVFDKRMAFGAEASHLSLVSSGADAIASQPNDALIHLATRELNAAMPRARTARRLRATVVRERRATFSLAPGQPARPPTTTPLKGFLLAGDWTDTGLPGTIESAVVSGHRAAAAALKLISAGRSSGEQTAVGDRGGNG